MKQKHRAPSKAELAQLQKLYKTDEKIGERLGGVPAYLVAYWRRKKNIAKHSAPKFSDREIMTLWERLGDDDKCGLELGISKAAFYNWRRRYGILKKPDFLKLEQLELNLPGAAPAFIPALSGQQTIARKILARASGVTKLDTELTVSVEPHLVSLGIRVTEAIEAFQKLGVEYVWNPSRIAVSNPSFSLLNGQSPEKGKVIREFSRKQNIKRLFEATHGSLDQQSLESGCILPGQLALSPSPFGSPVGALGALGLTLDRQQIARLLASGRVELPIPTSVRLEIAGRRPRGVSARDIELTAVQMLGAEAKECVIELAGSLLSHATIAERITLCDLGYHLGALAAICPFDAATRRFLAGRTQTSLQPLIADRDAIYEKQFVVNIDSLTPKAALVQKSLHVKRVEEWGEVSVNQVVIGTMTNGRFEDLRQAAEILRGKKVHPDCRLLVIPATDSVYLEALKKGLIRNFVDAGATVLFPGFELFGERSIGVVGAGERGLTTFGFSPVERPAGSGELYVCSVATAAASAIEGKLVDPSRYVR